MKKQKFLQKEIKMLKYVRDANRSGRPLKDVRQRFGSDLVDEYLYYDFIQLDSSDNVIITISGNDKIQHHYEIILTRTIGIVTLVATLVSLVYQLFIH